MPNTNCLERMQCPKCSSFEQFLIGINTLMRVSDEGVEEEIGDNEWDDESYCECCECSHAGTVSDFAIAG
jgi:hypothetical protein